MIRPLIIVVNLIIVMIFKLFVGTPSAEVKAPSSVKAGEAFLVEVTIQTNGETDFMRYSMEFPIGWTVEKVETAGASYKFDKQAAKFLWSRVGDQKELKISYKVTAPADASGDFSFNNKLSHTVDNLPSNIDLTPMKVNVVAGNNIVVATKTDPDSTAKPSVTVNIERVVPKDEVGEVFLVDLVIHKEDLTSFGKIEDTLPSGFTAKLVKADGGEFKFENGVVKFTWFVLPAKHTLNIQYRVIVSPDLQGNQTITGHFSYVENETGKIVAIPTSIIKLKSKEVIASNTPDPNTIVKTNSAADSISAAKTNNKQDPNTVAKTNNKQNPNTVAKTNNKQEPNTVVKTNSTPDPNPVAKSNNQTDTSNQITSSTTTAISPGVNFSVQIAAMTRIVPVSYYKNTFHIVGEVNTEQDNGLNKYTTGSFPNYQTAHDHREEIKGKGVADAFVTAHSNGKRITIQEALMITSQKWIR